MQRTHLPTCWESVASHRYPSLNRDMAVDVVVVGAGITGLTAALLLQRQGKRVAILEAFQIGSGTSGATTAHLTTDTDHDYTVLVRSYGVERAALVRRSLTEAIDRIEMLAKTERIDCQFRRVPGYLYTEKRADLEWLDEELEALQSVGMPVERVAEVPLPFKIQRGILFSHQAAFHPLLYLNGLAKAFVEAGGLLFEQSKVASFTSGSPCTVVTSQGTVTADQLILATHTPLGLNPLHAALAPVRSFVLSLRTSRRVPDALFWDTEEPYNYLRLLSPEVPGVVIVGGKDRKTAHGREADSFAELEAYARERFDDAVFLERWSAQLYDPADHVPFIGKSPVGESTYLATGFSGDGMTYGTLAGVMLSEQIFGRKTPYDDLYRPARLRLSGLKELVHDQLDVAKKFVGDRLPGKLPHSIADMAPSTGRVVSIDGKKIAAYCDASGKARTFSAVCPHLGCLVRWNESNGSFDCPCHGSRFSDTGDVIEGPSVSGLRAVDLHPKSDRAPT